MIAFLDCLRQFMDHVESRDPHVKLPYKWVLLGAGARVCTDERPSLSYAPLSRPHRINKDKIGDKTCELSIRVQFNHEETWTKALKFLLTNLKWCLAWVCKADS